jgi:peptide/nickel transport system substrate-binding protein
MVDNPNYFMAKQGFPYLSKIVFQVIADENTILNNAKAGSVTSTWFLDVSKTASYKALQGYKFVVNPDATNVERMVINFQNPILGHYPEVRKAMAMAIDHNTLIQDARKGTATPLCTDHGAGLVPGYQANAPCPQFNPTAANQLLDQNGWVKGSDGVRTKNGMRLEFKYSTTSGKPWRDDDESIIQSNFQAIGIKIDIQNYPANTFFGSFLPSGKHDIAEFEDTFTYDANDATITSCAQIPSRNGGQGENYSWYCNPKVDQLQQQEEASSDPTVRQNAFNQLHQIYLTDYPFIALYSPQDAAIVKSTAHNYAPGPMGASETIGVWQWWCTNGQC